MTLIAKAYELAKKEILNDWSEVPGPKSNPRITKAYGSVDGLGNPEMLDDSATAWCSVLMNWIIQSVGGKGTRSALARSWLSWGKSCEPKEGCLVVFKRGDSNWQGHIAFYVQSDETRVWCIGGNQSNDFKISTYLKSDVLDYRTSLDDNLPSQSSEVEEKELGMDKFQELIVAQKAKAQSKADAEILEIEALSVAGEEKAQVAHDAGFDEGVAQAGSPGDKIYSEADLQADRAAQKALSDAAHAVELAQVKAELQAQMDAIVASQASVMAAFKLEIAAKLENAAIDNAAVVAELKS